jgi:hypothetical protein
MDNGSVYRRCGCRDENTGRLRGARCPGVHDVKHGSWYFSADLPSAAGEAAAGAARRVRHPRGGGRGDGGARVFSRQPGAGADYGGVARPVAGIAGVAVRVHRAQL